VGPLVTALYSADRQADALDALRRCTELLRDELGIDPGPELRELERRVLRQDPALARRAPRPALTVVRRPRRGRRPSPRPPTTASSAAATSSARLRAAAEQAAAGRPAVVVLAARPASARPGWPRRSRR
jgi:DNA-binding SARP family transcriptional activator